MLLTVAAPNSSESLLSHVEQLLRAFILKISVCDAVLDNNPPGKDVHMALGLLGLGQRQCPILC